MSTTTIIFCIVIPLILIVLMSIILIFPICNYFLNRPKNRIEWRCKETKDSVVNFSNKTLGIYYHICDLEYRVKPSQLNLFVRIFGDNKWKILFPKYEIWNQDMFKGFIENFQTIGDVNDFIENDNILWKQS